MQSKAIILDRDGVINEKAPKHDYVRSWSEFRFLPGVKEAISLLTKDGYKIFIATNQRGISRGFYSTETLNSIHSNMLKEIEKAGGKIEKIYFCPHGNDDNCECRKPRPGMLLKAIKEYDLDPNKLIFVGDSKSDIKAANAANIMSIYLNGDKDLLSAVKDLLKNK